MKIMNVILNDADYHDLKQRSQLLGIPMAEIVRQSLASGKNLKIVTQQEIKVRRWTLDEWSDRIRSRDNYTCAKCGMAGDEYTTIAHHIRARKQGGGNTPDNGMTLCKPCHGKIHSKQALKEG